MEIIRYYIKILQFEKKINMIHTIKKGVIDK